MSADLDQWAPHLDGTKPPDIRFRPGPGGEMSPEWAAYMLHLWWAARDKKLAFGEAAKLAVVHFMVEEPQ